MRVGCELLSVHLFIRQDTETPAVSVCMCECVFIVKEAFKTTKTALASKSECYHTIELFSVRSTMGILSSTPAQQPLAPKGETPITGNSPPPALLDMLQPLGERYGGELTSLVASCRTAAADSVILQAGWCCSCVEHVLQARWNALESVSPILLMPQPRTVRRC